jgi:hypothetical protein
MLKVFCKKCNIEKEEIEFAKSELKRFTPRCNDCRKKYKQENKERFKESNRLYREKNKEKYKKYKQENRAKKVARDIERKANDPNYKLAVNLRGRLGIAVRNNYKAGSAVRDLGCSIEELKQHLESKFQEGMTWENWSRDGWHIDHVKPLVAFDLTNREQFLEACHYTNLQPLWSLDNLKKGIKVNA